MIQQKIQFAILIKKKKKKAFGVGSFFSDECVDESYFGTSVCKIQK